MATLREIARASDHLCAQELDDCKELRITPLHQAAYEGNVPLVQELLKQSADSNSQDLFGWTPLHDAAFQGHASIVSLFLEAGAQINMQDNEDLYTPLHDAVEHEHLPVIELLVKAGALLSLKNKEGLTPLELASKYGKKQAQALLIQLEKE
jgi:ankyrin repeat protein